MYRFNELTACNGSSIAFIEKSKVITITTDQRSTRGSFIKHCGRSLTADPILNTMLLWIFDQNLLTDMDS